MTGSDLSVLGIDRTPSRQPHQHRRRWTWTIATASIVVAAGAAGAKYGGPVSVETAAVTSAYPSQGMTLLNASGYVVAQRKAAVASKATGRLEWLEVVEGSRVQSGQVIARLESRDVEETRAQAAAMLEVALANLDQGMVELADAERNFKRSQELVARNFISEAAHDSAVTRRNKAQASLKSLQGSVAVAGANLRGTEVALDQTAIRAPFDGVVLAKHANVGDTITPFSNALDTKGAVVTIADMSTLEVEADVSESSLGEVRIGQHVEIQLDAVPDRRFPGMVNRIVPTVDRAKATVLVKVGFLEGDERVLPDMSAKVAFLSRAPTIAERKRVTVAPATAVVERAGDKFVYVVSEGRARKTAVETGQAVGELLELRGVDVGDKVVLKPLDTIADGTALQAAQQ